MPSLHCPSCGYDLTGNTTDTCPECGNTFNPRVLRMLQSDARDGERHLVGTLVFPAMLAFVCSVIPFVALLLAPIIACIVLFISVPLSIETAEYLTLARRLTGRATPPSEPVFRWVVGLTFWLAMISLTAVAIGLGFYLWAGPTFLW